MSLVFLHKEHGHFKKRLSKISEAYLNNEDIIITELNGLHFLASFPIFENDHINDKTDGAIKSQIYHLICDDLQRCRIVCGTDLGASPLL